MGQAFEVLLRRHQDRAYRIALRLTGSPADAEDVAVQLRRMLATCSVFVGADTPLGDGVGRHRLVDALDLAHRALVVAAPRSSMKCTG